MIESIQWMFAGIGVLDDYINNIKMVDDKAEWSISLSRCCIRPKTERREHSGNQRGVVGDLIDRSVIRAIVHSLEHKFELDGCGGERLSDNFERYECNIIHIMVCVDSSW